LVLIVPGFLFQGVQIGLRGRTQSDTEMTTRILGAFAISVAFALTYVALMNKSPSHLASAALEHPRRYALLGFAAAFVVPAGAAYVAVWVTRTGWWASDRLAFLRPVWSRIDRRPSAWDVTFGNLGPCYVRVRMSDGTWFAGWFGERSYASSWPDPQTLFVEVSVAVDENGTLGLPVDGSAGAMIDCTEAVLVETISVLEAAP
jgi:hypothetical protein